MRIQNSLNNIVFGLTSQVISAIMGIIVRTVFISTLGIEYLGVNGLFTNILLLLSLANLGFDTAIIYSLYKPLAEGDKHKIQGLMNLFEKAYRLIGLIILTIGLVLLPFLPYLMNGETTIPHIQVIYLLFLINSVSSYYSAYKHAIIVADQKNHIISKIHTIFTFISNLIQILLLVITKNFIVVLTFQIIISVMKNIYITHKANQLYPYIKGRTNAKLSKEDRQNFFKNLYSLMLYKLSGVVINGTDNIVISVFFGVYWVGIYSNYYLIIATLNTFLSYIFHSMTASVGNLIVKENEEKKYHLFRVIQFCSFWIYGLCSICLWFLINPVITLWLGDQFLLSNLIVIAIILEFYTAGMQRASTIYRETTGLFRKGKYRPLYAAAINIIASIILAQAIGITGVFLGTIISRLCVYFWYDPYVIFKYTFQMPVGNYFMRYIKYGFVVLIAAIITESISRVIPGGGLIELFMLGLVCIIIPNVLFILIFRRYEEFEYLFNVGKSIVQKLIFKRLVKKSSHM